MLAIIIVLALVASVGIYGVKLATKRPSTSDVGYSYPTTTTSSPYPTTTTTTASSSPTRTTRTTTPDRTTTTTPRSRTTTTTTTTTPRGPQPVNRLADNPLFSTTNGVNQVTCNLPAWRSDPQSSQQFFTAALPCMETAWAPAMQRAGLPYSTPGLKFPSGTTWQSPCGSASKGTWAAFYCPKDNTIYLPFEGLQTETYGTKTGVYLALFAHEFAHHIQELSGVNQAYWNARYEAGDQTALGLELSRRSELQAQCFGGMWFAGSRNGGGSVTDQVVRDMLQDGYTRGDWKQGAPRDHGSPQHTGAWQEHGYKNNRTAPCNTWSAAPADVS
ncbi:neutral zinc metallopeptidase [Actinokineospora sp. G85]|uniref:neutral zinc metallopeptidase n=1 Tax=Actinokineospora sp. G85 TaxID=3406626 RepID=UPI003C7582BB